MRGFLSIGVKDWAEIIGIMTDKDSQGDEEILIYAMTLINKVNKIFSVVQTYGKQWHGLKADHLKLGLNTKY